MWVFFNLHPNLNNFKQYDENNISDNTKIMYGCNLIKNYNKTLHLIKSKGTYKLIFEI